MKLTLTIIGQVHGGKNNMGRTRYGKPYPKPVFQRWRNGALLHLAAQTIGKHKPIFTTPVMATVRYTAGDRRRRDVPALMDALWHVLERSGVVADDALIRDVVWNTTFATNTGGVVVELEELTL